MSLIISFPWVIISNPNSSVRWPDLFIHSYSSTQCMRMFNTPLSKGMNKKTFSLALCLLLATALFPHHSITLESVVHICNLFFSLTWKSRFGLHHSNDLLRDPFSRCGLHFISLEPGSGHYSPLKSFSLCIHNTTYFCLPLLHPSLWVILRFFFFFFFLNPYFFSAPECLQWEWFLDLEGGG